MIVTKDNNLLTWGNVFKEKNTDPTQQTEGFSFYYGDSLFDGCQIQQLEAVILDMSAACFCTTKHHLDSSSDEHNGPHHRFS